MRLAAHEHPAWEDFGVVEWVAVAAAAIFVIWTIWLAVKYTLFPGEDAPDHHKRLIFSGPDVPSGPDRGPDTGENDGRGDE